MTEEELKECCLFGKVYSDDEIAVVVERVAEGVKSWEEQSKVAEFVLLSFSNRCEGVDKSATRAEILRREEIQRHV